MLCQLPMPLHSDSRLKGSHANAVLEAHFNHHTRAGVTRCTSATRPPTKTTNQGRGCQPQKHANIHSRTNSTQEYSRSQPKGRNLNTQSHTLGKRAPKRRVTPSHYQTHGTETTTLCRRSLQPSNQGQRWRRSSEARWSRKDGGGESLSDSHSPKRGPVTR